MRELLRPKTGTKIVLDERELNTICSECARRARAGQTFVFANADKEALFLAFKTDLAGAFDFVWPLKEVCNYGR